MRIESFGKKNIICRCSIYSRKKENIFSILVMSFERLCDSMGLNFNVGKSKVLVLKKDHRGNCEKARVNGALNARVRQV